MLCTVVPQFVLNFDLLNHAQPEGLFWATTWPSQGTGHQPWTHTDKQHPLRPDHHRQQIGSAKNALQHCIRSKRTGRENVQNWWECTGIFALVWTCGLSSMARSTGIWPWRTTTSVHFNPPCRLLNPSRKPSMKMNQWILMRRKIVMRPWQTTSVGQTTAHWEKPTVPFITIDHYISLFVTFVAISAIIALWHP